MIREKAQRMSEDINKHVSNQEIQIANKYDDIHSIMTTVKCPGKTGGRLALLFEVQMPIMGYSYNHFEEV